MRTWNRVKYLIEEVSFDYNLHAFEIVQDGAVVATIVPPDLYSMDNIVADLDAGYDVYGWEDGLGNAIHIN